MTIKEQCLQAIEDNLTEGKRFVSIEELDTGESNRMTFFCSKEHLINLIEDNFDDDLKGAVPTGHLTTILSWEFISEEENT